MDEFAVVVRLVDEFAGWNLRCGLVGGVVVSLLRNLDENGGICICCL